MSIRAKLVHGRQGTAAIEFGLMIPILLVLLMGLIELGFAVYQSMQVQNSAEAGALYAIQNDWNSGAIANAVVNATGTTGIAATPAPTQFCGCADVGGVTEWSCSTNCPNGNKSGRYGRISAEIEHKTILPYPGLPLPKTFTAHSIVRLN